MLSSIYMRLIMGLLIFLIIDLLCNAGIKLLFQNKRQKAIRWTILRIHWLISIGLITWFIVLYFIKGNPTTDYHVYRSYQSLTGAVMVVYASKFFFAFFYFIQFITNLFKASFSKQTSSYLYRSSSSRKLKSNGFVKFSIFLSLLILFFTIKGIIFDRKRIQIKEVEISSSKIPSSFDGFRVTLISDIHMGSFYSKKTPAKLRKLIQETNPDLFLCAGDMVNTSPYEALRFLKDFAQIDAPYGKYTILGNHDMDDFAKTDRYNVDSTKIDELIRLQKHMGFKVLLDEHTYITKGNDQIALLGIKNWGLPPFYQYGNLSKATYGMDTSKFSILLSHDPSHWPSEVVPKTNIDLTLSGHTHAFQMGFSLFGWQWSPVSLIYPYWNGHYQNENQSLYVTKGVGFLGYPGRIGMLPEIVVITLKAEN